MVRHSDEKVMFLKRVVAVAGDTVEFRAGRLYVNGEAVEEDYVTYPCDWTLPEREVKSGHVYVVGDNRSMAMKRHVFGQTPLERIAGGPLW